MNPPNNQPMQEMIVMKNRMSRSFWLGMALLALAGNQTWGQVILTNGHVDGIGIGYESGAWDLHIHDEDNDMEYEPDEAIFFVPNLASNSVPANPLYSFLGSPGDPVWILPQTQVPGMLYLGSAAHEVTSGTFVGGNIRLELTGMSGPAGGNFFLYQVDGFGVPTVLMNTANGINTNDFYTLPEGGHAHYNWAFTKQGLYTITVVASGTLTDGNVFTQSDPTDYQFMVVIPEPSTALLVIGGLLGTAVMYQRRRRHAP